MTRFSDNIYTGDDAVTSAKASRSGAVFQKTLRFSGASGTQTFTLPVGVQNLHPALYIMQNGSAAATNKITVSAGGTTYFTYSSFGSTGGYIPGTTQTGVATFTAVGSAMANLSTTAEVTCAATYLSTDAAVDCQVCIKFNRVDNT